ncbi:hypothetical protein MKS82_01315 [Ochrobactrum sp. A-1]|nr:hypothetical protein [Ochrobactrum sp. Res13-Abat-PEA25-P4-01-A]MCH4538731.1 hypothetical protein [Ochrobactrum sp. A-1]
MAGGLPDDRDGVLGSQRLDLLATMVVSCHLIVVHKQRAILKFRAPLAAPFYLLHCLFYAGEWIASTGIEVYDLDMKRQVLLADNIVQELSIGLFRLAFTSEKNWLPGRDMCVTPPHPI